MDERPLPHSLDAERAVLGAILIEPELFDVAASTVAAPHFFRAAHRTIWEAYGRIRGGHRVLDPLTLRDELERAGRLDEAGGPVYLSRLIDGVPKSVNVEGYARIVREKATLRDLVSQARQTIADALEGSDEVDEVIDRAESRLMAVGRDTARGEFLLASDWMTEVYAAVERATVEKRAVTGVPCGLASIDNLTRGWQPADLIVIAGRPSDGKTSIALQFALEASKHVFTAFVSLEMSRLSVGFRAVALEARVDAYRLMTGRLEDYESQRVGDALARLAERRLAIDDAGGQSIAGLCAKVRRLAARYGAGIVFVDYLQLLHGSGTENRTQEITQISGRLKGLAKELNVPLVVLSQLTRDNQRGPTPTRPQLHHLRDGGSIEQDSDVVIAIHRPNKAPDSGTRFADGEVAELLLLKQRNGPANRTIETVWNGPTMRFADKSDIEQPVQGALV